MNVVSTFLIFVRVIIVARKAPLKAFIVLSIRLFVLSSSFNCPSVCPSIRKYQHGSHSTNIREFWYCGLSWIFVEKRQIWFKEDRNIGHFKWRHTRKYVHTYIHSPQKHCCATVNVSVLLTATGSSTNTQKVLSHFSCNNGYVKAPWCHVQHALTVCLIH
jgi:hypothetical protein